MMRWKTELNDINSKSINRLVILKKGRDDGKIKPAYNMLYTPCGRASSF